MISLVKCLLIKSLLLIALVNANWSNSPVCVQIPANFTLCRDIGYSRMKIPNLLNHESLAEAFHQANGWLPLLQLGCNPHTKLFLCSLFTPVCLDKALDQSIPPCRSLCESVKSSCLPQMIIHGFDWPRIVDCNQYPLDNGMCINAQQLQQSRRKPQDTQIKTEQILQQFCQSDWVLKVKGTLIVNNLNETATLHVHNYTVLKGEFANEQQKILPVFVNDLRFWNQLLTTGSSEPERPSRFRRQSMDRHSDRFADRFNENRFTENRFGENRFSERPADRQADRRSKQIQTFKRYTFILFGRTTQQLNGQTGQKLTLFFPLTNKLPYLKKLYYKRIRANRVNCDEQPMDTGSRTKSDLESILYFEQNRENRENRGNQPAGLRHQSSETKA